MTETVYVPGVVPGFVGPLLALPQATIADAKQISNALNANSKASLRCDLLAKIAVTRQIKSKPSHAENIGTVGPLWGHIGKTEDGAVVEIVSVEVVLPEPGVTLGCEKEHDVSDGNPEQASETKLAKEPATGETVIMYVALLPRLTDAVLGLADTEKSCPVPVSVMLCGLERRLSAILIAPGSAPAAVGVKVTFIVQFDPAARDVPQLFVWL